MTLGDDVNLEEFIMAKVRYGCSAGVLSSRDKKQAEHCWSRWALSRNKASSSRAACSLMPFECQCDLTVCLL